MAMCDVTSTSTSSTIKPSRYGINVRTIWGSLTLSVKASDAADARDRFQKLWNYYKIITTDKIPEGQFKIWVSLLGNIDIVVIADIFNEKTCQFETKEVFIDKSNYDDVVRVALENGKIQLLQ
jgi:hypothetical protein